MCLRCEGWTDEELLERTRREIEFHGWGYVHVEAGDEAGFTYTVGLTRFHGHPELVVTGLDIPQATALLDGLAAEVRGGLRLADGDLLVEGCCEHHRLQLVRVKDPLRLAQAQQIYASVAGLVPGLQVVYTDACGHWPWDRPAGESDWRQPIFGRPRRR